MSSIFTKIINGEIPCHKIAENASCFAFLDIAPVAKGHVLVIPKKEVDQLFDLDNKTYIELLAFSKEIAIALKKAMPCKRIGMSVIGLEVAHAHVHLIPLQNMEDINFSKPKLTTTSEELEAIASKIKAYL